MLLNDFSSFHSDKRVRASRNNAERSILGLVGAECLVLNKFEDIDSFSDTWHLFGLLSLLHVREFHFLFFC